ncbi:CocE/NonD family hydrolase [Streptomyces boncukensis]|uniref:CocE/NonD family hydrolase n=1 Tax=Streptomyces boncukensis TaxID=2711219 RepID=A0A6G4WXG3_9ACTN|nr:CocE/NonD family hydrolase [Streptomyces boncukensis]NGO69979.1 CocE/NonD family hydrolase [Streptomyces boncukensis]
MNTIPYGTDEPQPQPQPDALRRRAFCALGAATALTTALTATASAAPAAPTGLPDPAAPPDPFFSYGRPAVYGVVREDVHVPLRDGSRLAAQLYRPADRQGRRPAPGRFPGLVYEYTAYAANLEKFGDDAAYFVRRGYLALVCQVRGSGESPGTVDPFSPQEQRDNYDAVEWLARHPASTGRIGQSGVSYGGHTALLAAVNRPPHLKAIIPVNALHDWYENTIYRGGIYSARIRDWQRETAPGTLRTYAAHPLYDDFWRGRSVMSRWDALTVPTLEINGWYDRYRDGMVKNYLARPGHVWLVSGPWEHGPPQDQYAGIGPGAYLAWWDRWLARDRRAPLPAARVTSYEIPGPGAGSGWQQFGQWPPRDAGELTLRLRADGSLRSAPGPRAVAAFDVNTGTTAPRDHEQLRFATRALRRDLVLAGDATARVRASFTATDGNIAAVLYDQAPDGTARRITAGWLKASHRHGHTARSRVVPGAWYDIEVHIWPTHYRLAAGHRLVLRVSSDDYPEIDADAPAGRVRVRTGAVGSELRLTARDDRATPPPRRRTRGRPTARG